jgi:hypothetical protein
MKHKKAKLLKRLVRGGADDAVKSSPRITGMTSSMTFADSIDEMSDEQRDIFFPVLEDLTDELMDELVETKAIPRARLLEARSSGWKYNRKRGSFMSGEVNSF